MLTRLATLLVREPNVLQAAQDTAIELFGDKVSTISARNMALEMCLPLYKELKAEDKNLLVAVIGFFYDMSFQVGVTDSNEIFTSDIPGILIRNDTQVVKLDEVVLPISSNLVLYMFPYDNTPRNKYNRLFKLKQRDIEYVNKVVASRCKRWIYSKVPLSEKQIDLISIGRSKV